MHPHATETTNTTIIIYESVPCPVHVPTPIPVQWPPQNTTKSTWFDDDPGSGIGLMEEMEYIAHRIVSLTFRVIDTCADWLHVPPINNVTREEYRAQVLASVRHSPNATGFQRHAPIQLAKKIAHAVVSFVFSVEDSLYCIIYPPWSPSNTPTDPTNTSSASSTNATGTTREATLAAGLALMILCLLLFGLPCLVGLLAHWQEQRNRAAAAVKIEEERQRNKRRFPKDVRRFCKTMEMEGLMEEVAAAWPSLNADGRDPACWKGRTCDFYRYEAEARRRQRREKKRKERHEMDWAFLEDDWTTFSSSSIASSSSFPVIDPSVNKKKEEKETTLLKI